MGDRIKKRKKQLTFDQKCRVIQDVLEKGRHKKDVADEWGIHVNSITNWVRIYKEKGLDGLRPNGSTPMLNNQDELQRLKEVEKKYNEQLVEIEILKKFQAFLKESGQ